MRPTKGLGNESGLYKTSLLPLLVLPTLTPAGPGSLSTLNVSLHHVLGPRTPRAPCFNQRPRWVASGLAPPWRLRGGQVASVTPAGRVEPLSSTFWNLENCSRFSDLEPYQGPSWMQPSREFCASFLGHSLPPFDLLFSSTDQYYSMIVTSWNHVSVKVHPLTLNNKGMSFCSRKSFKTLSTLGGRFRWGGGNHASFRIKDPCTGCHVCDTYFKRRWFPFPHREIRKHWISPGGDFNDSVTNSSFLRCGQADPFSPFPPCLFYISKWVGEKTVNLLHIYQQSVNTSSLAGMRANPWAPQFTKDPSLHFPLKFKAMDEENKNALPLQMCVGGSYLR